MQDHHTGPNGFANFLVTDSLTRVIFKGAFTPKNDIYEKLMIFCLGGGALIVDGGTVIFVSNSTHHISYLVMVELVFCKFWRQKLPMR